jgi:branched-chain amino acid aminotransferase
LFGEDCNVTEAGASNLFVVWKTEEGKLQLVTASLDERIVLDGVTRRSVLELARERLASGFEKLPPIEVVERKFTMFEIQKAAKEGRLVEAFAAGTAWFIAPVGMIRFRGEDIVVPQSEGSSGLVTKLVKGWLKGIMWGEEGGQRDEWGYVVEEK